MTLTNEQLARLDRLVAGAVASGYVRFVTLDIDEITTLVSAYRTAQTVRRQGLYAIDLDDREMVRNLLNQLPPGGSGKLWAGE